MGRLEGRVAVVTGGGDGIGRAICRRFAAEGAKVLVAELHEDTGRAAADELTSEIRADARFVRTDVRDKGDVLAMIATATETWGTVDVLVNNAWGGGSLGRVENKTDAAMARGMDVGFYGPLWAMQAAFPFMRAQGRGNVINLCSLNGVNAHMGTLEYNSRERGAAHAHAHRRPRVGAIRDRRQHHLPGREEPRPRGHRADAPRDRSRMPSAPTRPAAWAIPRPTSLRSRCSSRATTPGTSRATRSSSTAGRTSTVRRGRPISRKGPDRATGCGAAGLQGAWSIVT